MSELYYTPPTDTQFVELKEKAIELWKAVDKDNDRFGYASEKINRIKDLANISDNFMMMVAMFDMGNQLSLAGSLTKETRQAVADRMSAGGTPDYFNVFLLDGTDIF